MMTHTLPFMPVSSVSVFFVIFSLLHFVMREDFSPFRHEVSIRKRRVRVGSHEIQKEFIFICAVATLRNQLELPPDFLRRAYAGKLSGKVAGHLYNLQLNANFYSLS